MWKNQTFVKRGSPPPDFQMLALEARYARLIARMLMNVSAVEDCMKNRK